MNKLVVYYQPFVMNQRGQVIYQKDEKPICDFEFRANDIIDFDGKLKDYNIDEIEIYNGKMAKPFIESIKSYLPEMKFTLKDKGEKNDN